MGKESAATVRDRRSADRRRVRAYLVYPERRTGFDRRTPSSGALTRWWVGMLRTYQDNSRAILLVLLNITVLNIADFLLTHRALGRGAVEGNPIMATLFASNPWLAAVIKIGIGLAVVGAIWLLRRYRRILELSIVIVAGFGLLFVYSVALSHFVLS